MPSSGEDPRPSREEAIRWLRPRLRELCNADRSICRVAAELGIFCRGFRRWPERELHERLRFSLGTSTHLNRRQMETLADLWQLSEQLRFRVELACDAATLGGGPCRGWDELSDEELRNACFELSGTILDTKSATGAKCPDGAQSPFGVLTPTPCPGIA